MTKRMDKKKVLIAIIVIGLLLSGFTVIAGAYYVGSSESDVFHYPSCYHVDRIKPENLIHFDTCEVAEKAGYRPCKHCTPCSSQSSEVTDNAATCITTVDDDGGADFIMIQDAINNAKDSDTIIVYSGIYYENVVVDKSVTLKGIDHPRVDAVGKGNAITLSAEWITLEGFTVRGDAGITVTSNNNRITGNKVSNNKGGIYLINSSNNTITGNTVSNNGWSGIRLNSSSCNNNISGNIFSNGWNGILFYDSSNNNAITGNTFVNDGLSVRDSYHNTMEDNTVNGKPLVYLEDVSDYKVEDAGQVILVNCTNITVEKLDLYNTSVGIALLETEDSKVLNNTVSSNSGIGIRIYDSSNNSITGNTVSNNHGGIVLYDSSNNSITGNTVSNNGWSGIRIYDSSNNSITGNNASNNHGDGVSLLRSSNNTITGNILSNNGGVGISLFYSSSNKNTITGNNVCSNNRDGISLSYSSNKNTITGNHIRNNDNGIRLTSSSNNNSIYFNNFINNTCSVYSHGSTIIWNSPLEITYTYKGKTYESYLGNYWSDYEEKYPDAEEIDSTGIWNTPYSIDDEEDIYPLVWPIENFGKVPKTKITPINITEANLSCDNETLRIGAFNIQVFGKSKASKEDVMGILAKIIRTYDIVAIQEIRDKDQTALPKLVNLVNSKGAHYDYVVGPRLGRSSSKEQYAYIYNNQTVDLNGTPWTYPEPNGTDPFHREPYIAAFRAVNGSFDATMIVIHVDPDNATEEINALSDVVNFTRDRCPNESDIIIMGNLNADCSYFDEDSNCSICGDDYYWCINNSVDTTTSATNCTYDRIIITSPAVPDYTGDSGVFRYDLTYNLTKEETKAVSDHYPIYAQFYCDRDIDTPEKGGYPPLDFSFPDCAKMDFRVPESKMYLIAPITYIAPISRP